MIMHTSSRPAGDRSIGAILIDSGRLTVSDAERILRVQKEEGLRFGDAALKAGLLTQDDIAFALARQYDYPYLHKGESDVSDELIAAFQPFSPQVEALRALRSQLMLRCFTGDANSRILAVTSPGRGDGRSWLVANLAVVFSQLGERTLLIDADLRASRQHELFKLENRIGLSSILSARAGMENVQRINSFVGLSVLTAGPQPPNPQELLGQPAFPSLLEKVQEQYDVVLIDTPPDSEYADVQIISARAGSALVLARKHHSSLAATQRLVGRLGQVGVTLVGSVLTEY